MSKGGSATSQASVQNARKNLTKFLRTLDTVPTEELERSAQRIKERAIAMTPYKDGKLEKAVYVRVSRNKTKPGLVAGASARSKNGYNYAGIQHENTSFNHPVKGEAHYISKPFNQEVANLKRRLKRRLRINGS